MLRIPAMMGGMMGPQPRPQFYRPAAERTELPRLRTATHDDRTVNPQRDLGGGFGPPPKGKGPRPIRIKPPCAEAEHEPPTGEAGDHPEAS